MISNSKIILFLTLTLLLVGTTFALVYKWVDEEGKVHYGDCPPPECQPEPMEIAPNPSEEDIQQSRERADALIRQQKQRAESRQLEREIKQKQAEQRKVAIKKKCKVLRSRLFLLKQPGVITMADEEGNMMRPTDVERETMINDIEAFLSKHCK